MLELNWQILWTFVNLLILYLFLKKFLFKPVTSFMETRAKMIEDSIKEAKDKNLEADKRMKNYKEQLSNADVEATEIIKKARERAFVEYDKILLAAKKEAEKMMEVAEETIQIERDKAMNSVKNSIVNLAFATASKMVEKNMDISVSQKMIGDFIAEVGVEE